MGCGVGIWDQVLPASVVANKPRAGPPTKHWDGFGQLISSRESPCGTGFCQYHAGGPDAAIAATGGLVATPGNTSRRATMRGDTRRRRVGAAAEAVEPPAAWRLKVWASILTQPWPSLFASEYC